MSLIKHLQQNIHNETYEGAIRIGKEYITPNGGNPKVETITRKLRSLVAGGKLKTKRKGKVITGYYKEVKQLELI